MMNIFSQNTVPGSSTKICQYIPYLVNLDNNRHFTWRPVYVPVSRWLGREAPATCTTMWENPQGIIHDDVTNQLGRSKILTKQRQFSPDNSDVTSAIHKCLVINGNETWFFSMNQRPNITVTNRNLPSHQAANSLSSCDLFELLWNLPWQNVESKKKNQKNKCPSQGSN